jgi:hypothetical protein
MLVLEINRKLAEDTVEMKKKVRDWAAYQSLGASFLVGDEGNVPAVLLNVHFELGGEHLLDVLPRDGVSQA